MENEARPLGTKVSIPAAAIIPVLLATGVEFLESNPAVFKAPLTKKQLVELQAPHHTPQGSQEVSVSSYFRKRTVCFQQFGSLTEKLSRVGLEEIVKDTFNKGLGN